MLTKEQLKEYLRLWDIVVKCMADDDRDFDEVDDEAIRIQELQFEARQALTCCEGGREVQAIVWTGSRWSLDLPYPATRRWDARNPPKRVEERGVAYYHFVEQPCPTHCPYCGTVLPEMEKFDPGVPVGDPEDEYECGQCGGRHECRCLPPGAGWRPKTT